MAKNRSLHGRRVQVSYGDVSMWVIPRLREARNNLDSGAEEIKRIDSLITQLARKERSGEMMAMDASI
ncbi:MAG: hypothetical protein KGH94_00085 [Candidatus Micrarchaeota archaeon]|nr:hypothetical protein [Candidatus Micrarchaeota archaeon]